MSRLHRASVHGSTGTVNRSRSLNQRWRVDILFCEGLSPVLITAVGWEMDGVGQLRWGGGATSRPNGSAPWPRRQLIGEG
jgi:hypothetical protein